MQNTATDCKYDDFKQIKKVKNWIVKWETDCLNTKFLDILLYVEYNVKQFNILISLIILIYVELTYNRTNFNLQMATSNHIRYL